MSKRLLGHLTNKRVKDELCNKEVKQNVERVNMKPCTKFEVSSSICFPDIVEGRPNILGLT